MSAAGPVARIDAGLPLDATLIDCDVHTFVPGPDALRPHLAAQWAEYAAITGFTGLLLLEMSYPSGAPTTLRPDLAALDRQDSPVAALDLMRARVLDPWGATGAILNCAYPLGSITNPDLCEAMASALNDWLVADWLDPDRRLRASLLVPLQFPELAVREIHRVGDHPGFVQVLLPVRGAALYGNRRFHPVFEAAAQHGLVVGIHFGGYAIGSAPTASGWPSYYIEEYAGMAAVFQSQVRSIVFEGVLRPLSERQDRTARERLRLAAGADVANGLRLARSPAQPRGCGAPRRSTCANTSGSRCNRLTRRAPNGPRRCCTSSSTPVTS